MRPPIAGLTAMLALISAGCSSSTDVTTDTTDTCSIVLTGSVTATEACTVTATYTTSPSQTVIAITAGTAGQSASVPYVSFVVTPLGVPLVTTYTQNTAGLVAALSVTKAGGTWTGTAGGGVAPNGLLQLAVSSVTTASLNNGGAVYTIHGTGLIALNPTGTATGTVSATLTF